MENALSLKEIAELTYGKMREHGSFNDWCRYLLENKEHIWTICDTRGLCGMMVAKITAPFNLYVMEFVTLRPGYFGEFINRVNEFFGEVTVVEYKRRGRLKKVNYQTAKRIANYE